MLSPFFFWKRPVFPPTSSDAFYGALVNTDDDTVLTVSPNRAVLLHLYESMMDVEFVSRIPVSSTVLEVAASLPEDFPTWSWDFGKKQFKTTKPELIDNAKRERSVLATKKAEAITKTMEWVNRMRARSYTGFFFQESIYAKKEQQARELRARDHTEEAARKAPYVVQYAEDRGISLRAAADEIIFQAEQDSDILLRSEKTRLELLRKIRAAKSPHEVDAMLEAYLLSTNV